MILPPEPEEIIDELRRDNEAERIRMGFREAKLMKQVETLERQLQEEARLAVDHIREFFPGPIGEMIAASLERGAHRR